MRAGGCTVQQALTPDASAIVKQAVGLARRRGHAQVTPLHVANTMLSSSGGLLRSACLRSHSHPLQCKALELCFNVALNRLPASSSPILGGPHHHHPPSLSNALVAAFKRAQAHQRRGSIESQQQPLLAVKIELEQLVISILDDPSVSRVMREAGFSSTQVKSNVEHAVPVENPNPIPNPNPNPSPSKPSRVRSEDVTSIIDGMTSVGRSVVVVGECVASAEGVVKGVMDRVEKGEVPDVLRSLQFITLPLCSFRSLGREEVEMKVAELRRLVRSCCVGNKGVVLYLGDLSWAAEYRASGGEKGRGYYCPLEHVIMEIRVLVCGGFGGESVMRSWVMGVATYQTYTKCKVGNPSLEVVLGLQALTIPTGALELSLNCDSNSQILLKSMRGEVGNQLTCCSECSTKFENEARNQTKSSRSSHGSMITSTLPSWLQQYKEENKSATNEDKESLKQLCKKWNSICDSSHKYRHNPSEITLNFSSSSISSYDQHWKEQPLWIIPSPNNSTSSSDTMEAEYLPRFKEINAENLKILCNALERKVTWQKAIIPEITSTILRCRSGMMRRKGRSKEETWLFFQGGDVEGKEKIARELASVIFGSRSSLVSIELGAASSSTRSGSTHHELGNKRARLEASNSYLERFSDALRENPHRVFLVEGIEQVDSYSRMGLKGAMEKGSMRSSSGEEISLGDAIVILSCESFDSRSRACSPMVEQKMENEEGKDKEIGSSICLDLNLCIVDEDEEDCSLGDVGLLESVDRAFFFELAEEL